MTEAELKRAVVELAEQSGWLVYETPQVKPRRPVKGRRGYPDLTLARNGTVLWMELKQESGHESAWQRTWATHLPSAYIIRPSDLPAVERMLA